MPELNNLVEFEPRLQVVPLPDKSDLQLLEQYLRSIGNKETFRKRNQQLGAFWHAAGSLQQATPDTLRDFRDELDELKPSSRNAYMAAVRKFYRWLRAEYRDIPWADMGGIKDEPQPDELAARILTPEQVLAILGELKEQLYGQFWYTLFRFQYETAARIGEVCALKWDWVTPTAGGASFTLFGKFGKTRWVQTGAEVHKLIRALPVRGERVFMVGPSVARTAFKIAARAAGCEDASTHWLRHSRLSHLAALGVSLVEIRDFAGHKDISITSRYLHVSGPDRAMPETLPGAACE